MRWLGICRTDYLVSLRKIGRAQDILGLFLQLNLGASEGEKKIKHFGKGIGKHFCLVFWIFLAFFMCRCSLWRISYSPIFWFFLVLSFLFNKIFLFLKKKEKTLSGIDKNLDYLMLTKEQGLEFFMFCFLQSLWLRMKFLS